MHVMQVLHLCTYSMVKILSKVQIQYLLLGSQSIYNICFSSVPQPDPPSNHNGLCGFTISPDMPQVTDAHDRHTLMTVLQTYYNPPMLEPGHPLSPSGVYQSMDLPNHKAYLDYISSLPIIASPDVFGLHDNADISKDLKETNLLLDSLLLTQSRDAAGTGLCLPQSVLALLTALCNSVV